MRDRGSIRNSYEFRLSTTHFFRFIILLALEGNWRSMRSIKKIEKKNIEINWSRLKHCTLWTISTVLITTILTNSFLHFHLANIFHVSMTQETASPWRVRRERGRERQRSVCASVCAVHPCDSYMGALEADGVGRWKRLTLGSRCYRFGRSMEPERSQINLYTRFPLFLCTLLTDNYYFPLLKRVPVYIFCSTSMRWKVEGWRGG